MAVDLPQLGKLLALTHSDQVEEAARAEELFTRFFFRWCTEQGFPANVGLARLGEPTHYTVLFAETLARFTNARVLRLSDLDLAVVGTLPECTWFDYWFEHAIPEITTVARRSAATDMERFQIGALRGIYETLRTRRGEITPPEKVRIDVPKKASLPMETNPAENVDTSERPPAPEPQPFMVTQAVVDGENFGAHLARRLMTLKPLP